MNDEPRSGNARFCGTQEFQVHLGVIRVSLLNPPRKNPRDLCSGSLGQSVQSQNNWGFLVDFFFPWAVKNAPFKNQ